MADEIIQQVTMDYNTKLAEKSISAFTQKILKSFEKVNFKPFDTFLSDIKIVQAKIKVLKEDINKLASEGKEVTIKYNANEIKEMESHYKKVSEEVEAFRTALNDLNKFAPNDNLSKDFLSKQLNSGLSQMADYENIRDSGYVKSTTTIPGESTEEYAQMQSQLEQYTQTLKEMQLAFGEVAKAMPTEDLKELQEVLNEAIDSGKKGIDSKDIQNLEQYQQMLSKVNAELKNREAEENKNTNAVKKSSSANTTLRKALSGIAKQGSKLAKSVFGGIKDKLVSVFTSPIKAVGKLTNGISFLIKAGLGIRGLYMLFRKLRSYIQEGVNTVASGNATVKSSVATLSATLYQLKTALGVIVSPLVNVLAPAFATIAQWATAAANAIARFFASITGQKTVVQASLNTTKFANALEDASGSAEDATKSLADFDDIHVLDNPDSGSSGSGSSGIDAGQAGLIDTTEVNDKFAQMWENADFTELGKELGEKFKDALDSIDWEGTIKVVARKVGKSIATFFNGIIDVPGLGASLGKSLSEAFNTGVELFNSFVTTFDFAGLGNQINSFLRSAFANLDAETLAESIHTFVNGILTTLINAFDPNSDTAQTAGTKVGEFINALFSEDNVGDTTSNLDTLCNNISTTIDTFLTTLSSTIEENHPTLSTFIDIIKGIIDVIGKLFEIFEKHPVASIIVTIALVVTAIVAVNAVLDLFKKHSDSSKDSAVALADGFSSLMDKLGTAAIILAVAAAFETLSHVIDSVSNLIQVCGENSDTANNTFLNLDVTIVIIAAAIAILVGVFSTFKGGTVLLIAVLALLVEGIKVLGEAMPPISEGIALINDSFGDLAKTIGDVVIGIIEAIGDAIAKPVDSCNELLQTCSDALPTIVDYIVDLVSNLKDAVSELKTFAKQSKSTWENASKDVTNYKNNVESTITNLKNTLTSLLNQIKSNLTTTLNQIKASITSLTSEVTTSLTNSLTTINTKISETLKTIKTNVETNIKSLKELLTSFSEFIKDVFNSSTDSLNSYGEGFKNLVNKILSYMQTLADGVATASDAIANSINNLGVDIPSWVSGYGGKSWHPNLSGGVRVSIPKLAEGAVLPPNQPFLAMLGDQKSGTNIEAPLDTIVSAMQQALGGTSGGNQEITLNIDGTKLARIIMPYNMKEMNRQGYNVKVLEGR